MHSNSPQPDNDARLRLLGELLRLQARAREQESADALAFFMVNETHRLLPYRQALLWQGDGDLLRAASGLATLDSHAPLCREIVRWCRQWRQYRQPQRLDADRLDAGDRALWQEYLPPHGLWLPLTGADDLALLLLRDSPWPENELRLLNELAGAYGHAWRSLTAGRRRRRPPPNRRWVMAGLALLVAIMVIPVRQSVIAPAEVVAHRPALVRAPLAGVIDEIVARPNQPVTRGQVLLRLDSRELQNQLESARQQFAARDAEYRQAQQLALSDADAKAQLAVLASRREQGRAEMAFLQAQLARTELSAPRDGVAIFDDVSDLLGRPVSVGERIMQVADPQESELEILLPAADAIALSPGAEVRLFLNVAPDRSQPAELQQIGYRATLTPDNMMAYKLRARFQQQEALVQIGLKGSAKIYGERTVLIAWLLRKPWSALRVWLGV
ncbi:HlyD family efflux transporter periplasmic adaptor subunit [Dickeya chrysanthemi]|uniref:efflux RND transporter periplasmic adaptor subunit n=1 Tax=Dickeya chrysanthemi TaxID=556 RepID=UPI0025A1A07A|nr:HlyD family efflux transporter periplasmic adaptor subunit [Dickeya chrysanthemi]WJM83646.1 HlyD family efflux transporter periplasmic adaptor subunit [Dickeya chrysanthemi]